MRPINNSDEMTMVANALKAMGHPIRLRIMLRLAEKKCCVGEVMGSLLLPQSSTSQHLKILKDSGALEARREGTKVFYMINDNMLLDLMVLLDKRFGNAEP